MQAILSGFIMTESGDLAAAEESYVGRWPGLATPTDVCSHKAWDMPCALAARDKKLAEADQVGRARLLATGSPACGWGRFRCRAWVHSWTLRFSG